MQIRYDDDDEDEGPQPDPTLEQGVPIPVRMQGGFPPELASTPLEDIDAFYSNQLVSLLMYLIISIYIFCYDVLGETVFCSVDGDFDYTELVY